MAESTTASLVAVACFNFFFLPPVGTFTIADPQNWIALFTLLAVSIVVSRLSTLARTRAIEAASRRDELGRLFDLTRELLLTTEAADPIAAIAGHIARRFQLTAAAIYRPDGERWTRHEAGTRLHLDDAALTRAMTSARATLEFDARARAYAGTTRVDTAAGPVWLEPIRVGTTPIGLVALQGAELAPGARDAIAGVAAVAIERLQLLDERKSAELVRRSG